MKKRKLFIAAAILLGLIVILPYLFVFASTQNVFVSSSRMRVTPLVTLDVNQEGELVFKNRGPFVVMYTFGCSGGGSMSYWTQEDGRLTAVKDNRDISDLFLYGECASIPRPRFIFPGQTVVMQPSPLVTKEDEWFAQATVVGFGYKIVFPFFINTSYLALYQETSEGE